MGVMLSQTTGISTEGQKLVQANNKETPKLHITGPLQIHISHVDSPHKKPLL